MGVVKDFVDGAVKFVKSDVGKIAISTGTQVALSKFSGDAEREGLKQAAGTSEAATSEGIATQFDQFAAQLQFQREQAVNERALAERLQTAAIGAEQGRLDQIISIFERAITLEKPFQVAAEGFISPLQRAISEFPDFKPILDQPISDAEIKKNIPKALTDLQQFQFGQAERIINQGLSAAGLSGSGAGIRAREEALRPLSLNFALQGFQEGQNRVLLNEARAVQEQDRKIQTSVANIGALGTALQNLRANNQIPNLLTGQARAIGDSSNVQAQLATQFGNAQLGPLARFNASGGQAFSNLGTNITDLVTQGGLNLANIQFQAGQSRANQLNNTGQAVTTATTQALNLAQGRRSSDAINKLNQTLAAQGKSPVIPRSNNT